LAAKSFTAALPMPEEQPVIKMVLSICHPTWRQISFSSIVFPFGSVNHLEISGHLC
jgi:hypothetical protein